MADHVSYVSFGFCATSFQLIVTILIYLFHPSVGFFPVAGWTLVSADLPFQALFLKRDICSFSKPFTGCFSSDLSIASKVSLFSLFATTMCRASLEDVKISGKRKPLDLGRRENLTDCERNISLCFQTSFAFIFVCVVFF